MQPKARKREERKAFMEEVKRKDAIKGPSNSPGSNDPLVVMADEVAALLKPLIDLNGLDWVARRCGTGDRSIVRVMKKEIKFVMFKTADRWLTNLGAHHALSDGTVRVVPNPAWSREQFERHFVKCGDRAPMELYDEVDN